MHASLVGSVGGRGKGRENLGRLALNVESDASLDLMTLGSPPEPKPKSRMRNWLCHPGAPAYINSS